jgi:PAS domain S-box-containing protein
MVEDKKSMEQLIAELNDLCSSPQQTSAGPTEVNQPESGYSEILGSLSEPAYVIQDGSIKFINAACLEMSGYSSEELVNRNPIETFVYLEDQEIVLNHYLRRLKGDITPHKYDFRLVCKDGSLKWIELKTTMILWEGRPAGLAVATDVSDAKRLQEALRSSEARFRNLFETSNDAILLSDRKTFLECNPKAVEIFGCQDQKDIVGHSIAEFIPENQPNGSDSAVVGQQYMKATFDNVPQTCARLKKMDTNV